MHAHTHSHAHHPASRTNYDKRLAFTFGLTVCYMLAEVLGAKLSGSLALLADAGHMLSDAAALALSWFAVWFAKRPATSQQTYGYYRTEILVTLLNGAALLAIAIYIFIEAYQRFLHPPLVQGNLLFFVASGGLLVNLSGLWLLHSDKNSSLNVQGAFLHIFYDALGSIAAIFSGLGIWLLGINWLDSVASVFIGSMAVYSAWYLIKTTVGILMEAAPTTIHVETVRKAILAVEDVIEIHDLHVWTITSGLDSLSAHVVVKNVQTQTLNKIHALLQEQFGIKHATLQLELADFKHSHRCSVC